MVSAPVTVPQDRLRLLARDMLAAAGSDSAEAGIVADNLVEANLCGHDSHGVGLLPMYLRDRAKGHVHANRHVVLLRDDGTIGAFDGVRGFGHVMAREATEWGIARACQSGTAIVALRNAYHVGRVGTYGQMACDAGLVSVAFVNVVVGNPKVAPFGGADGRLETNPVCIGVPGGAGHEPLLLDFATSRIAAGKVRVAHNAGKEVPPGALIDHNGAPTRNPNVLFAEARGSLLPFGEHKGSGLALMCELLGGALTGGPTTQTGTAADHGLTNSMLMILIDPARLVEDGPFHNEIGAVVRHVKASPPLDPAKPVLVAGEPERQSRAARIAAGVPIDPTSWGEILTAAKTVGVATDGL